MGDRAIQALYKLALDPIAETTGDPNSYGFRKGTVLQPMQSNNALSFYAEKAPPNGFWKATSSLVLMEFLTNGY